MNELKWYFYVLRVAVQWKYAMNRILTLNHLKIMLKYFLYFSGQKNVWQESTHQVPSKNISS